MDYRNSLIVTKDKYSSQYFKVESKEDLLYWVKCIFNQRLEEDTYINIQYQEPWRLEELIRDEEGQKVLGFLKSRSDYEYEGFEIETLEVRD